MSAYLELLEQCARRGWRVGLDGAYRGASKHDAGLEIDTLVIRSHCHELLVSVPAVIERLDGTAVDAARALEAQGLIT